jgi:hypothetical protein
MLNNPEFIKNFQLEFSLIRSIFMPVILGMIFFTTYLINKSSMEQAAHSIQIAALVLLGIIVFVWGTKIATESLVNEFNEKTWDSQRMTTIGPFDMTCGKLFGSTIFAWYGGLICLLTFTVSSFFAIESTKLIKILFIIIFAGIFLQSTTLSFILLDFEKKRYSGKLNTSSVSAFIIILLLFLTPLLTMGFNSRKIIFWYGFEMIQMDLLLYSSIFFSGWGLTGLYRKMRSELQFENNPWVWLFFNISLMVYGAGFSTNFYALQNNSLLYTYLLISFLTGGVLIYTMALVEPKSIVQLRWLLEKAGKRKWKEFILKLPAWFISLVMVILICAVLVIMRITMNLTDSSYWFQEKILTFSPLPFLFFCLRDLGIIIYANLKNTTKNSDFTAIIYLLIAYLLIPIMLSSIKAEYLMPWFIPYFSTNLLNSLLPVSVQTFLVFYLLKRKWPTLDDRAL